MTKAYNGAINKLSQIAINLVPKEVTLAKNQNVESQRNGRGI
jgi:hypothetical protein